MSEEFARLFLSPVALRNVFVHMCKTNSESPDPIVDTLTTILTHQVQFCVSKYGLVLFKNAPPLPYTIFLPAQRQLIYDMCNSLRNEVPTFSAFALNENPLTYNVENEKIIFNVEISKLDPKTIISILVDCLRETNHYPLLLFNLILQRLNSRVNVTRDIMEFAGHVAQSLEPQQSTQCYDGDQ